MASAQPDRAPGYGRFFKGWMQDPLSVGALAPSGRSLAKLMTAELYCGARVLELGAGTGNVTEAILNAGVQPSDLYLVDRCEDFVAVLEHRFAGTNCINADALALAKHLAELRGSFDFIVSGLPLMLFSRRQKLRLLLQCFELLRPEGALEQFTYAGRCPVSRRALDALGLAATRVGVAARNLPPAFVYRIERCRDAPAPAP